MIVLNSEQEFFHDSSELETKTSFHDSSELKSSEISDFQFQSILHNYKTNDWMNEWLKLGDIKLININSLINKLIGIGKSENWNDQVP